MRSTNKPDIETAWCPFAPPCPMALSGPPVVTVVPSGSTLGVVLAGCNENAAFLVPPVHLQ